MLNLILQVSADKAYAVALPMFPKRSDLNEALNILAADAGIIAPTQMAMAAKAVGLLARTNESQDATEAKWRDKPAYPYPSHQNYAAEGHDPVLDADAKREGGLSVVEGDRNVR